MIYDTIIIGAGAAGLTAAIYAARANKTTLVLESTTYGGQIITSSRIENYPGMPHVSGIDFAKKLYNQAVELGAKVEFEEVRKIENEESMLKKVTTDEGEYLAKTIIIATGSHPKKLGIEDEERLSGRGVSYCATCDGALYKDKTVAIVGGGNTAFYDALYLSSLAKKVYIIHRRDEFRADESLVKKAEAIKNIESITSSAVSSLNGDEQLESITVKNVSNGQAQELKVSAVFIAVGRAPSTEKFENLIDLNPDGYIISGEDCLTSEEGIFAAGDVRTKSLHQLVTATADGAVAATAAINYLNKLA